MDTPGHLGGHLNLTENDKDALLYLVERFKIKNLLDVGCGPMGVVQDALDIGLDAYGVDGDFNILYMENIPVNRLSVFDFIADFWKSPIEFDAIWSVGVAEHVVEEHVWNFIHTISNNLKEDGVLLFLHGEPGQGGYHHVNCKPFEYWAEKFKEVNIHFMEFESEQIRKLTKNMNIANKLIVFEKRSKKE